MVPDIATKEEALEVARQLVARHDLQAALIKKLQDDDMLGLECAETVQLERSMSLDARDGWRIALWLVQESLK